MPDIIKDTPLQRDDKGNALAGLDFQLALPYQLVLMKLLVARLPTIRAAFKDDEWLLFLNNWRNHKQEPATAYRPEDFYSETAKKVHIDVVAHTPIVAMLLPPTAPNPVADLSQQLAPDVQPLIPALVQQAEGLPPN